MCHPTNAQGAELAFATDLLQDLSCTLQGHLSSFWVSIEDLGLLFFCLWRAYLVCLDGGGGARSFTLKHIIDVKYEKLYIDKKILKESFPFINSLKMPQKDILGSCRHTVLTH